ncbi:MAG: hypothetical protein AB7K09_15235 [Planctomycetota bacterium]
MKKFIAIIMVVGLASMAMAQDLDSAQGDIASANQQNAGGTLNAYDLIISKILEKEAAYIAHSIIEAEWMVWGRNYWHWTSQTMQNFANGNQSWNQQAAEANAMWEQLSPAEATAAVGFMHESHQRVLAAGLN